MGTSLPTPASPPTPPHVPRHYDDGTGDELVVSLGTTRAAFVSGYALYDRLTPEEQAFTRIIRLEYVLRPAM